ncbi:hypothetical protein HYFRA_00012250 [Hymenoscyphus fraxineus]|uniref:Uncharacterized protein n=1 Tax=Hymenoscyphus fraxineus TaxID=746836 RepID=A0A9N9PRB0_9HELO|nr:hypothetical protein HYFRA_00012250 [Hymenoscyphus fraxineus]
MVAKVAHFCSFAAGYKYENKEIQRIQAGVIPFESVETSSVETLEFTEEILSITDGMFRKAYSNTNEMSDEALDNLAKVEALLDLMEQFDTPNSHFYQQDYGFTSTKAIQDRLNELRSCLDAIKVHPDTRGANVSAQLGEAIGQASVDLIKLLVEAKENVSEEDSDCTGCPVCQEGVRERGVEDIYECPDDHEDFAFETEEDAHGYSNKSKYKDFSYNPTLQAPR